MMRCLAFMGFLGLGACATTRTAPPAAPSVMSADVTYTISAATLADLAQTGQDYKLALTLESGADGQRPRSCTVAPVLPAPKPLAQRLVISR